MRDLVHRRRLDLLVAVGEVDGRVRPRGEHGEVLLVGEELAQRRRVQHAAGVVDVDRLVDLGHRGDLLLLALAGGVLAVGPEDRRVVLQRAQDRPQLLHLPLDRLDALADVLGRRRVVRLDRGDAAHRGHVDAEARLDVGDDRLGLGLLLLGGDLHLLALDGDDVRRGHAAARGVVALQHAHDRLVAHAPLRAQDRGDALAQPRNRFASGRLRLLLRLTSRVDLHAPSLPARHRPRQQRPRRRRARRPPAARRRSAGSRAPTAPAVRMPSPITGTARPV